MTTLRHFSEDPKIELRFARSFRPFRDTVVESGLPFSGVRLSNAEPGD